MRFSLPCIAALLLVPTPSARAAELPQAGKLPVQSMSALAFGPEGVLFIGDSKAGAVWALDLDDKKPRGSDKPLRLAGFEARIAALLGTHSSGIMIHDMAVNPISQNVYFAVSRGRSQWDTRWQLPNDVADANILIRVTPAGEIDAINTDDVRYGKATLPNPVGTDKTHKWKKGTPLRVDTITDMAFDRGTLYVAGLSNEEFASSMWRVPYPFQAVEKATTLEIYHGAHGAFETHAPIRTFLPYQLGGKNHLLAAYLCTPLVTFEVDTLQAGQHVKGRTVAEFGSGNYPLDMVVYKKDGKDRLLIANSNLPLMIVDPADVAAFEGSISELVKGYVAGVKYEIRSGVGVQQLDKLNDTNILALQRLPGGTLDLVSLSTRRF